MNRCRVVPSRVLVTTLALGAIAPLPASAQSQLSAEGLGMWVEALDARARALGGTGVGLPGWYVSEGDPAASAGLTIPAAGLTYQASSATLTDGGTAGYTRFPNAVASYPYRGNVFSVVFGGFLDQEWEARVERTIELGGAPVDVMDVFTSSGGVGRIRLGWARGLPGALAVGVTAGTHVGSVERFFSRELNPEQVGPDVEPSFTGARYRASGMIASFGAAWDPSPLFRLAGSVSWSDDLTFTPTSGGVDEAGTYSLPVEFRAGGTFTLTDELSLHFGTSYADWSDVTVDLLGDAEAQTTWSYGGGVQWNGISVFDRPVPIRLGARSRDLPFSFQGEATRERLFSGGIGLDLRDAAAQPLARIELGAERGSRTGGGLSEDFWRMVLSVRVASG